MKAKRAADYREVLLKELKDPKYASEYLRAAIEDDDPHVFLLAIKDVVDARGGMSKLAARVKLQREGLYKMLSRKGNPAFENVSSIVRALGYRFDLRGL